MCYSFLGDISSYSQFKELNEIVPNSTVKGKEVHESAIFGHCARPSSLVDRSKGSMKFFS